MPVLASGLEGVVLDAVTGDPLGGVAVASGASATISAADGSWRLEVPGTAVTFSAPGRLTVEWATAQAGRARLLPDQVFAYLDAASCAPGGTVRLHASSPVGFTIALHRFGLTRAAVADLGRGSPCPGRVEAEDVPASGAGWPVMAEIRVPTDARSGLYGVVLQAAGRTAVTVPLVVRPAVPTAALLVLANTFTWDAYNVWGGRSRYRCATGRPARRGSLPTRLAREAARLLPTRLRRRLKQAFGLPPDPVQSWHERPLSSLRPNPWVGLDGDDPLQPFTNHLAGGEWRVLAWLEREGIPYDLVACEDLHRDPQLVGRYRSLLLSTHAEYWSRAMYESVRRQHEAGLWIVNCAGNAIYREVVPHAGGMTCVGAEFARTCSDPAALLGTSLAEADAACCPYAMLRPDHWIFAKVPERARGRRFGVDCLNRPTPAFADGYHPGRAGLRGQGASGWETDRAAGVAGFVTVARGTMPFSGADLLVREPASGRGGVFSASSITFGGSLLVDLDCSTILRTVLEHSAENHGQV